MHHIALLLGYGAAAVNPYLVFDVMRDLVPARATSTISPHHAAKNYLKAAGKGVLKIMSKMGISTVASYTGAQVFEAIGLSQDLVDEYFTGTTSRLGGVGLDVLAAEVAAHHERAFPDRPTELAHRELRDRRRVPVAARRASTTSSTRTPCSGCSTRRAPKRYDIFKQYTTMVDEQAKHLATLRGLFELREGERPAGADRRGRADLRDREAVLHRRDELRLDLEGSARDARDRDEPHRREVEHR